MLAPDKSKDQIFNSFTYLSAQISRYQEERRVLRSAPRFAPAGQSTQMIVGATPVCKISAESRSEASYFLF